MSELSQGSEKLLERLFFLILFLHRHKDKAEALVAGMYAIRSQRPCAPGVLASHSIMFAIEEEVGEP